MPARPENPRVRLGHPHWLTGIKVPTGPPAVRCYTTFAPRPALRVYNFANIYESHATSIDGGLLPAAIAPVPTIDGCTGLPLDGSSQHVRFGYAAGIDTTAVTRFSAWSRFILRSEPANGVYTSPWGQWNEPGNSANNQTFTLVLANNALGYPIHSFLVYIQKSGGALVNVGTQYAASDVGKVWTLAATGDGATLHVWLLVESRVYHAATAYTGTVFATTTGELVAGRIDVGVGGGYCDMIALGAGVIRERALGLPEILELHRDPWGPVTPRQSAGRFAPAAAPGGGGSRRRRFFTGAR